MQNPSLAFDYIASPRKRRCRCAENALRLRTQDVELCSWKYGTRMMYRNGFCDVVGVACLRRKECGMEVDRSELIVM